MPPDPSDILRDLGLNYFERARDDNLSPGRICWGVVHYLPAGRPQFLHFDYEAANRGESVQCVIGPQNSDTFNHRPVAMAPYTLESSEAFIVLRAKGRPVVVLSEPLQFSGWLRRDFPPSVLACPLYSFKDRHLPEFRNRVFAMEYPMAFYLPDSGDFPESFGRFDRLLVLPTGFLKPTAVRLTAFALKLLREHLWWFLTGQIGDQDVAALRSLVREAVV